MKTEREREEFIEDWRELYEQVMQDQAVNSVEDFYTDILLENLNSNAHLSHLPEEGREALAEMAAKAYGEQARRILNSGYLDEDEMGLAVATAFLNDKKKMKVGAQAQGLVDFYWEDADQQAQQYGKENYKQWAFEVLIDPWPPHQLEEGFESVNRFKPPEDDPTYH